MPPPALGVAVNLPILRARGLEPESIQGRTYFRDPDGYKLQVGEPDAGGQRLV